MPHMKREAATKVADRYWRQLEDKPQRKQSASDGLFSAFQKAGFPVVYEAAAEK